MLLDTLSSEVICQPNCPFATYVLEDVQRDHEHLVEH